MEEGVKSLEERGRRCGNGQGWGCPFIGGAGGAREVVTAGNRWLNGL
jgi:hypothetical protein